MMKKFLTCAAFLLLLANMVCAGGPKIVSTQVTIAGGSTAISPTNVTTVSGSALYTKSMWVGNSEVQSISFTFDTTVAISAVVSVQAQVTAADDSTHWMDMDPSVSLTITGDYSKIWAISAPVSTPFRVKFAADTANSPAIPYEIEVAVLNRQ